MKPYYQDEWTTIYNEDSSLWMPDTELIITDPPYGIGEDYSRNQSRGKAAPSGKFVPARNYGEYDWDEKISRLHLQMMLDSSLNQIIWGGNYYADWLPSSSKQNITASNMTAKKKQHMPEVLMLLSSAVKCSGGLVKCRFICQGEQSIELIF